jgi:hypothetical protein
MFSHSHSRPTFPTRAALIALSLALTPSALLAESFPFIESVEEMFTTAPSQLTINGVNFGTAKPTVTLGGIPVAVVLYTCEGGCAGSGFDRCRSGSLFSHTDPRRSRRVNDLC